MSPKYWLLKAEPNSRVVKGKDVKFSIDDFEAVKVSPWEGVRNYEARNLLREMEIGDKALFYHSNCRCPGVVGFAEVSKKAYPDHTAWDESHPYYDPKTDKDNPRWYMPDVSFVARVKHFVPLTLLKSIVSCSSPNDLGVGYIGDEGVAAVRAMTLITRGRLSVQRVEEDAWKAIEALTTRGGWDESATGGGASNGRNSTGKSKSKGKSATAEKDGSPDDKKPVVSQEDASTKSITIKRPGKRKTEEAEPLRSTRRKT